MMKQRLRVKTMMPGILRIVKRCKVFFQFEMLWYPKSGEGPELAGCIQLGLADRLAGLIGLSGKEQS